MMWNKSAATAALTILLMICSQVATLAVSKYPIPFSDKPDWQGFKAGPPASAAAVLRAHAMTRLVVVVWLNSAQKIDSHSAAHLAYQNLFTNAAHLPAGPLYAVVIVYGPPNSFGAHPEYAYVFKRDSEPKGWQPRLVSENELTAVECALRQSFLVGHGAC